MEDKDLEDLIQLWLLLQRRIIATKDYGHEIPSHYVYLSEMVVLKIIKHMGGNEILINKFLKDINSKMAELLQRTGCEQELTDKLQDLKKRCYPPVNVPDTFKDMMKEFKKEDAPEDPDPHITDGDKQINKYLKEKKLKKRAKREK